MKFLKNFGLGLVNVLLLPLLLAVLALFAVYGLFVFFAELLRVVFNFFKGEKNLFPPLDADNKVEIIKKNQLDAQMGTTNNGVGSTPVGPAQVYIQQNYYQGQAPTPNQKQVPQTPPLDVTGFYKEAPSLQSQPKDMGQIDTTTSPTPDYLQNPSHPQISEQQPAGYLDDNSQKKEDK